MQTLLKSTAAMKYGFRCHQSSKWTSQETEVRCNQVKRSRLSVVIGRFQSILFVSIFQGSFAVAIVMIDSNENVFRCSG